VTGPWREAVEGESDREVASPARPLTVRPLHAILTTYFGAWFVGSVDRDLARG
jgi:hypothetical protein